MNGRDVRHAGRKHYYSVKKQHEEKRIATPREAASSCYARWLRKSGRIEPMAEWTFQHWQWDLRDRAFFLELLYGAVRHHGRLQWLIEQLSPRQVRCSDKTLAAVATGLYQILFLDRVPAHAAVDTAVETVRRAEGPAIAGWANAILRRVGRETDEWREATPKTGDESFNLSMRHSHPHWLVRRWMQRFDRETVVEMMEWNNRRPGITLRVNLLKTTISQARESLAEEGFAVESTDGETTFLMVNHKTGAGLPKIATDGQAVVQDRSQGLIAPLLNPRPEERILDLCSAPGGKTGHLSELCDACTIVATDRSEDRLESVRELIRRQGYGNVSISSYQEVLESSERYDGILVDAPCTGTGVLARRPDLRWRLKADDPRRMAAIQLQLMRYAAERVLKGGRIVYSTCSIEPEENENVVAAFLNEYPRFRIAPLEKYTDSEYLDKLGRLSFSGVEFGADGVFGVRLERWK